MDDKLKDRLQKLKNLAERGVGGEKETAEKKLAQLLKDNGLTESDLNDDEQTLHIFSYIHPYYEKLLRQIIYTVMGWREIGHIYKIPKTRNKWGIYCTALQKIEIDLNFEFYKRALDEEFEFFLRAFIEKQDIYPKDMPSTEGELTPEDIKNLGKMANYINTIDFRSRKHAIEDHQYEEE